MPNHFSLALIEPDPAGIRNVANAIGTPGNMKEIMTRWQQQWLEHHAAGRRLTVIDLTANQSEREPIPSYNNFPENPRSEGGFTHVSLTDFGANGRRTLLSQHKSLETAARQFARLWQIYGRSGDGHIWVEPLRNA